MDFISDRFVPNALLDKKFYSGFIDKFLQILLEFSSQAVAYKRNMKRRIWHFSPEECLFPGKAHIQKTLYMAIIVKNARNGKTTSSINYMQK